MKFLVFFVMASCFWVRVRLNRLPKIRKKINFLLESFSKNRIKHLEILRALKKILRSPSPSRRGKWQRPLKDTQITYVIWVSLSGRCHFPRREGDGLLRIFLSARSISRCFIRFLENDSSRKLIFFLIFGRRLRRTRTQKHEAITKKTRNFIPPSVKS